MTPTIPPWTTAPPIGELDDAADAAVVADVYQLSRLAPEHPIVTAWNDRSDRARRLLHQLAEDARLLRKVPGFGDLCKKIRTDVDGFSDSVYELRVAGSLARGVGQEVLRLGGSKAGPDVVARARSGHEIGVACYKARSAPRDILDVKPLADAIVRRFGQMYSFRDIGTNVFLQLLFPEFPIRQGDEAAAMAVLGQLWTYAESPLYDFDGVKGRRSLLPAALLQRGDRRRVRVRLEFPVREWDQRRVLATAVQKMQFESDRWARDYPGIAIFAAEESDGAHGGSLRDDLAAKMNGPNTFGGILLTHYPSTGLENIQWLPRQTGSLGLHIHLETMWQNVRHFAGNRALVTLSSGTAFIDHDFRTRKRHEFMQMGAFRSEWHSVRLPEFGKDFDSTIKDPRFQPAVEKALEFLRQRQSQLVPHDRVNDVIDLKFVE